MMFLPLPGDDALAGVVAAAWAGRRRRVDAFVRRAVELLAPEAGRVLGRLRLASRLAIAAETDPVTGLGNRRGFDRALVDVKPGDAIVVFDLDHFKKVNDSYGHATGDVVLAQFGRGLAQVVRRGDVAARYGGEEFAVVLSGAGVDGAWVMLDRLQREWRARRPLTTFSAGVAVRGIGEAPVAVFERADAALYRAKRKGRDRIELASSPGVAIPHNASVTRA